MGLKSLFEKKVRQKESCEINVVDHCNLTCRDCNHGSPGVRARFIDPDQLARDLAIMKLHYEPNTIKLVGGEPLLHPDILKVVQVVRESGLCRRILLITNGLLLPGMPQDLWQMIDALEVSVYPKPGMTDDEIGSIRRQCKAHDVELELLRFDQFRVQFSVQENRDSALVERIFRSCRMAQLWHCDSIHDGYFYRCPQSIYASVLSGEDPRRFEHDRLKIEDSRQFRHRLREFRESDQPLEACRFCLGTSGKTREHRLERKGQWLSTIDGPINEVVDFEFLELSEQDIRLRQGCRQSMPSETLSDTKR
jgi:cyclic pyranopterin phosphate synthase